MAKYNIDSDTAISQLREMRNESEPPFSRADEMALSAEADYYEGKLRGDT